MTILSDKQIAQYAYNAGFRNVSTGVKPSQDLTIAVAVALAESGGNTAATHRNSDSHGSTDLGEWQINNYWHRDLLAKYSWSDPAANAKMAYIIKTTRGGWTQWSTFNSGAFFRFMPRAIKAAQSVGLTVTGAPDPFAATPVDTSGDELKASIGKITDPHTWLRAATTLAGWTIVLVALAMLGWEGAPSSVKTVAKGTVKTAVKVAAA